MTSRAGRGSAELAVLVHHAGEQRLVERAPVDADADRLLVLDGALDHDLEIVVVFLADGGVAGIDAVLGESAGGGGKLLQQEVAVVVEVADDGDADAALVESFDDGGNGGGGFLVVHGDADDLGAGQGERFDLLDGAGDVGGVGVGHRLDDDRDFPAHADLADLDRGCLPALNLGHIDLTIQFTRSAQMEARPWREEKADRDEISERGDVGVGKRRSAKSKSGLENAFGMRAGLTRRPETTCEARRKNFPGSRSRRTHPLRKGPVCQKRRSERRVFHPPCQYQYKADPEACGKTRVVPHNRPIESLNPRKNGGTIWE